ncbi:MAG: ribosome-binding factor A [Bacteroidales bacterium]|nr:MAG: ribosome-binding factor A [Bacteroidales bacterium]
MKPTREDKVTRMLQKELGEIFLLYAKKMQGVIISVTDVRISPDLGIARIYLSIFPNTKAEEIFRLVEEDSKALRFELGKRIKNQLRIVPELIFMLDDSLNYLEKIDDLLKK